MLPPHSVSVICGVKDRTEHLFEVLHTWTACPEIGEIVIIDWSSKSPLYFPVEPLVNTVRVDGEELWQPGPCFNLGLQMATKPYVLKLDADVKIEDREFFTKHPIIPRAFYAGNHQRAKDENEAHLSGAVYAARADLLDVGGWNERITTYGYDDDDLYERLMLSGCTRINLNHKTLYHIPHSDAIRLQSQPKRVFNVHGEAMFNRSLAHDNPWKKSDKRIKWNVQPDGERRFACQREKNDYIEIRIGRDGARDIPTFTKDMFTDAAVNGPGNWKTHVLPLLRKTSPIHWLEVGSYEGMSAIWTVDNILQGRPGSTITCIDPWLKQWLMPDTTTEMAFDRNVFGIANLIKVKERSHRALASFRTRYHGIYINGSHVENDVYLDAKLGLDLLVPGAVMIFDDYEGLLPDGSTAQSCTDEAMLKRYTAPDGHLINYGVQPAVDRFLSENKHRLKVVYRGWQMILQVKGQDDR